MCCPIQNERRSPAHHHHQPLHRSLWTLLHRNERAGQKRVQRRVERQLLHPRHSDSLDRTASPAVEVMMAAAVERGGVRAAFLNPSSSGGGGGLAPTSLPTGATAGAVVLGSGSGTMPVPMNLFATWEIDRSSPSCVPRYRVALKNSCQ